MNKDIAIKWSTALRSGDYKQTCWNLKYQDCFCSLGVLCDISGITKWHENEYLRELHNLPLLVMKWAGCKDGEKVIEMDDEGMSFNEIADWIDTNYETV